VSACRVLNLTEGLNIALPKVKSTKVSWTWPGGGGGFLKNRKFLVLGYLIEVSI
jgi:hypothetical protein